MVILTITGIVYCSMPSIYIDDYTVYMWFVSITCLTMWTIYSLLSRRVWRWLL